MGVPHWSEGTDAPSGDRLWTYRLSPHPSIMHAFPPWIQEGPVTALLLRQGVIPRVDSSVLSDTREVGGKRS